jgi:hypothetical protein
LKAYVKSPEMEHTNVADRLGLTRKEANIFMKRFAHAMYLLRNDDRQIETMTAALNNLVKDNDLEISEEVHSLLFYKGL